MGGAEGAPHPLPYQFEIQKKYMKNIQKYTKIYKDGGPKFSKNPRKINLTRAINLGNQTV